MTLLEWDQVGTRFYETGVDRGVLYLPDNTAVPWNGLTGVVDKSTRKVEPIYFDGMKINDLVTLGDFEGTMSALTYPDELVELEGALAIAGGVYLADQPPKVFGLSYRTKIGNDVDGLDHGYKIHIIYNVTAVPSDKSYATLSESLSPEEFQWDITATPDDVLGFRPSAHVFIDSRKVSPILLEALEEILYGSSLADPSLISMSELLDYLVDWVQIAITDNGDGTWSANIADADNLDLSVGDPGFFTIFNANVLVIDDDTIEISDTP